MKKDDTASVKIDALLLQRLKLVCLCTGITTKRALEEAVEYYLQKHEDDAKSQMRKLLR